MEIQGSGLMHGARKMCCFSGIMGEGSSNFSKLAGDENLVISYTQLHHGVKARVQWETSKIPDINNYKQVNISQQSIFG